MQDALGLYNDELMALEMYRGMTAKDPNALVRGGVAQCSDAGECCVLSENHTRSLRGCGRTGIERGEFVLEFAGLLDLFRFHVRGSIDDLDFAESSPPESSLGSLRLSLLTDSDGCLSLKIGAFQAAVVQFGEAGEIRWWTCCSFIRRITMGSVLITSRISRSCCLRVASSSRTCLANLASRLAFLTYLSRA